MFSKEQQVWTKVLNNKKFTLNSFVKTPLKKTLREQQRTIASLHSLLYPNKQRQSNLRTTIARYFIANRIFPYSLIAKKTLRRIPTAIIHIATFTNIDVFPSVALKILKGYCSDRYSSRTRYTTLRALGENPIEIISASLLIDAIETGNSRVHKVAQKALKKLGEEYIQIKPLIASLKHEQDIALQKLMHKKARTVAIPRVVLMLKNKDPEVQEQAMDFLIKVGPKTVPFLTEDLIHGSTILRKNIVYILSKIGKKSIPYIEAGLKDKDPKVRSLSAAILRNIRNYQK